MAEDIRHIVVFVTVSNDKDAHEIADLLLERRKAACVNMVSNVQSSFWWKGNKETSTESLLMIKTKASVLEELIELVKQVHSYEVPEIIALPITGGNRDYLKWIEDEVRT